MDCRNFKDLLDSYLCEELTVETNHAVLRHAEHCGGCRSEMAARRQLREALRRACSKEAMSVEACERLRSKLRAEARFGGLARGSAPGDASLWRRFFGRFLSRRYAVSATAFAALLILAGGSLSLYRMGRGGDSGRSPIELSAALMDEAAEDHRRCAVNFVNAAVLATLPDSIKALDPDYVDLDKALSEGAKGLSLHSAHVCDPGARRFVHLVYTRNSHPISLLVTERDARAMKPGVLSPVDDGSPSGLQQGARDDFALGAYQTAKRVVLVVSSLPEAENKGLAERLAAPVAEHLRRAERRVSWERLNSRDLMASLIRF
ncbi:MAG: anti-sigma factor family protein [Blastocatellia bacterium]